MSLSILLGVCCSSHSLGTPRSLSHLIWTTSGVLEAFHVIVVKKNICSRWHLCDLVWLVRRECALNLFRVHSVLVGVSACSSDIGWRLGNTILHGCRYPPLNSCRSVNHFPLGTFTLRLVTLHNCLNFIRFKYILKF